ncbi:MAG: methyltransferase domain-containing protein [Firmicutes bacterium]|nr:methyltransferase domain-containing protein [Bacillota bacterium]
MAYFDKEAKEYDNWYNTIKGDFVDKVETKLALSMFNIKKGMTVLDIGCGTGNFSIKLAKMGCKVIGIDVSEDMLKKAKKKALDEGLNIEFKKMDVYNLDFNEKFDAVFSMAAFEFIKDTKKALDEMFRVVKNGGQILVGTINKDSKWGEFYLSDGIRNTSVFKYADFKTLDNLVKYKKGSVTRTGECLFIPPTAKEEEFNFKKEKELSTKERGGFICALWKK